MRSFTRFRTIADLPPEDLDILSERTRLALELRPERSQKMNEQAEYQGPDAEGGTDNRGSEPKPRPIYVKRESEATRELRDTSRRRRDAEEKLQQHLREAKEHVPHHHPPEASGEKPKTEHVDEDYEAGIALEG